MESVSQSRPRGGTGGLPVLRPAWVALLPRPQFKQEAAGPRPVPVVYFRRNALETEGTLFYAPVSQFCNSTKCVMLSPHPVCVCWGGGGGDYWIGILKRWLIGNSSLCGGWEHTKNNFSFLVFFCLFFLTIL